MAEILVPQTSRIVQVVGGNLFELAAEYLGDATQWNRIAKINGLWDPFVTGPVALKIPAKGDDGQGGILGL